MAQPSVPEGGARQLAPKKAAKQRTARRASQRYSVRGASCGWVPRLSPCSGRLARGGLSLVRRGGNPLVVNRIQNSKLQVEYSPSHDLSLAGLSPRMYRQFCDIRSEARSRPPREGGLFLIPRSRACGTSGVTHEISRRSASP